jgi:long-chain fatty acid transport protein
MSRRWHAGALVVALLSLLPESARATPQDLYGFGARSPGLAMTGASWTNNWEGVYLNPAGLGAARRRAISFGFQAAAYDLRLDDERYPLESARGSTIGFHLPLPFGDFLENRLVLGGGFYTPANVLLRGEVAFPEVPQWPILGRGQSIALQVGLGFDFHHILDGFRIGIGMSALANVVGALQVRLDESSTFTSTVETQLLTVFAPIAGLQLTQPEWGAGIVYRHEVRSEMDLRIVISDLPVTLPNVSVSGLIQYDPPELVLEGYWQPIPQVRIILSATTRFWSAFAGPYRPTTVGSNVAPAPEFSDTFSPRLAVEATARDGHLTAMARAGYAFELSPSPPARLGNERRPDGSIHMEGGMPVTRPLRFIDNDRHIVTIGAGIDYEFSGGEHLNLDLYGQFHFLGDRTHAIPLLSDTVDPMNAALRSSGMVIVGGWAVGVEF